VLNPPISCKKREMRIINTGHHTMFIHMCTNLEVYGAQDGEGMSRLKCGGWRKKEALTENS